MMAAAAAVAAAAGAVFYLSSTALFATLPLGVIKCVPILKFILVELVFFFT